MHGEVERGRAHPPTHPLTHANTRARTRGRIHANMHAHAACDTECGIHAHGHARTRARARTHTHTHTHKRTRTSRTLPPSAPTALSATERYIKRKLPSPLTTDVRPPTPIPVASRLSLCSLVRFVLVWVCG